MPNYALIQETTNGILKVVNLAFDSLFQKERQPRLLENIVILRSQVLIKILSPPVYVWILRNRNDCLRKNIDPGIYFCWTVDTGGIFQGLNNQS